MMFVGIHPQIPVNGLDGLTGRAILAQRHPVRARNRERGWMVYALSEGKRRTALRGEQWNVVWRIRLFIGVHP